MFVEARLEADESALAQHWAHTTEAVGKRPVQQKRQGGGWWAVAVDRVTAAWRRGCQRWAGNGRRQAARMWMWTSGQMVAMAIMMINRGSEAADRQHRAGSPAWPAARVVHAHDQWSPSPLPRRSPNARRMPCSSDLRPFGPAGESPLPVSSLPTAAGPSAGAAYP